MNRPLLASGFSIVTFGEDEAGEIYVADVGAGRIYRIDGSSAPRFSAAGVVNSASFVRGLVPGSLATVFAAGVLDTPGILAASATPLATSLGGVSVTIGGVPAPVHIVANVAGREQVNFQVPFEIQGRSNAAMIVSRDGQSSAEATVPVLDLQPAMYSSGTNAIVVHNADYMLVNPDRPLVPGEYAFVYAAGLGRVANQPPTGAAAVPSPLASVIAGVRVALAGIACDVQFAGLAPALVGVYQVNFRVPPNVPSGTQDLALSADGSMSPALTVPVGK